jgi:uncharacterized protein (DUF2141 family)
MKALFVVALGMLSISAAFAGEVRITTSNIAGVKGEVHVSICTNETFLKSCALKSSQVANDGALVFVFKDVPSGRYAAMAYHDENRNGVLDRNVIGIPQEGYGFSKDAVGRRGPPSFESASFDVSAAPVDLNIQLNY